jgi:hypothetical protein
LIEIAVKVLAAILEGIEKAIGDLEGQIAVSMR